MTAPGGEERRRAPRFRIDVSAAIATRSEQRVTGGRTVDASAVGVLLSFPGAALPVGFGDRCLVSLQLSDRLLHIMGVVRRKELGADQRYYVGIEIDNLPAAELEQLRDEAGAPPPDGVHSPHRSG
jgi:hypothetical protein